VRISPLKSNPTFDLIVNKILKKCEKRRKVALPRADLSSSVFQKSDKQNSVSEVISATFVGYFFR
jgi:hypothetical protein